MKNIFALSEDVNISWVLTKNESCTSNEANRGSYWDALQAVVNRWVTRSVLNVVNDTADFYIVGKLIHAAEPGTARALSKTVYKNMKCNLEHNVIHDTNMHMSEM